ncbi:MAG: hypothetical protein C0475_03720 [Planctomyces sp.]|nr:hypothetical protein [Planctomyces sp.]
MQAGPQLKHARACGSSEGLCSVRGRAPPPGGLSVLLIDTYNVLHVTGVLPPELAGPDIDGLIRLIGASRYSRHSITLVCDGVGARRASAGLTIEYAGAASSADDLIIERLGHTPRSKGAVVVSSDRRVSAAARRRGLRTLSSAAFLHQLARDVVAAQRAPRRPTRRALAPAVPLDAAAVRAWARDFGIATAQEFDRLDAASLGMIGRLAQRLARGAATAAPKAAAARPDSAQKPEAAARPAPKRAPRPATRQAPLRAAPPQPDPLLTKLIQESGSKISQDDLAMERWLAR